MNTTTGKPTRRAKTATRKLTSAAGAKKPLPDADALMASLDHPHKAGAQLLRKLIRSVDSKITEEVKWNAPSFKLADHFATLRLQPAPVLQVILHTGAKTKSKPAQFVVPDPEHLLKWAAPDRCVIAFASPADVKAKSAAFTAIVKSWITQLKC